MLGLVMKNSNGLNWLEGINFRTYRVRFCEYLTYIEHWKQGLQTSKWFLCKCMEFFLKEMNVGLKVTIKVRVKDNMLLQSLQTLARVNSVNSTNILSLIPFMWIFFYECTSKWLICKCMEIVYWEKEWRLENKYKSKVKGNLLSPSLNEKLGSDLTLELIRFRV